MCLKSCIHIDITPDMLVQAHKDEANIKNQKGLANPSTKFLSNDRDFIGSLGQNAVFGWFEEAGIYIEKTPYFNQNINNDKFDFFHRGANDVKSSPMQNGWSDIYPMSAFLISEHQKQKVLDWYTFVKVDLENMVVHIAGVISYEDFWKNSTEEKYKVNCNKILAKQLQPFRDYALGV